MFKKIKNIYQIKVMGIGQSQPSNIENNDIKLSENSLSTIIKNEKIFKKNN